MSFFSYNLAILIVPILYLIIHFLSKHFHHHATYYRIGALFLALLTILIRPSFLDLLITSGHLGLSFFILVIFTCVFPKKSKIHKNLNLVRGDLAILGFIFLIPHGMARLSLALAGYNSTGLLAMIVFTPLFITSFLVIRKKMKPIRWKKLHHFAYIAYGLIYIHLGFNLSLNPNNFYIRLSPDAILYHLLAIIYISIRVIKKIQKNKLTLKTN
jgi:methionine sulfoxide reductase heme-binding subunit